MQDLNQIKTDEILKPFFDRNPNFDLLNFNFFEENAGKALNWESLDKDTICDRLKARQQLLQQANLRLQHLGVSNSSDAMNLLNNKLDSARAIASISKPNPE